VQTKAIAINIFVMAEIIFKQVDCTRYRHSFGGRDKTNMRELTGSCVKKTEEWKKERIP